MNWNPISVGFIAIGVLAAAFQVVSLRRANASRRWASTQGVILACGLDISEGTDRTETIVPNIRYEYEVGGRRYEGDTISFGRGYMAGQPQRLLKRYPVGQTVRVFYNPSDRVQSCLEPGAGGWPLLGLTGSIAFIGVGVFVLLT